MSKAFSLEDLPASKRAFLEAQLAGATVTRDCRLVPAPEPVKTPEQLAKIQRDARVLEAAEQKEVTRIFTRHGFRVRSTSQYRPAKVSAGIPDLIVMHKVLPIGFWWETKRQVGGVVSEFQAEFADDCKRCNIGWYTGDRYDALRVLKELGVEDGAFRGCGVARKITL